MTFAPGQTIFFDGDEAKFFFEVVTGTIRLCGLTLDGRRQIYRFVGAGETLGLSG
jgi:CRP-like cAMP-binding protein